MQRRQVLSAVGVAGLTAIAGCSEDTDFEEGNGNGNGSGNGNGGSGEDEPSSDDIVITEHDMVINRGEFTDEVNIEGIVENNSGQRANYVEVTARIYDADGNQLDSYIDNTNELADGGSWAFDIMVLDDPDDIDSYDIAVEDTSW